MYTAPTTSTSTTYTKGIKDIYYDFFFGGGAILN